MKFNNLGEKFLTLFYGIFLKIKENSNFFIPQTNVNCSEFVFIKFNNLGTKFENFCEFFIQNFYFFANIFFEKKSAKM